MRSRLLECRVLHHRFEPREHRFAYRVFMVALDLSELDGLAGRLRLLGINRRGFFSVHERDFLPSHEPVHNPTDRTPAGGRNPAGADLPPLRRRVAAFLRERGVTAAPQRIELIAMPRVAGYRFNPVTFYFCHDAADQPLAAIAEVTNTFGEVKPFLLDRACWARGAFRLRVPKHFYVSPYSDVDVEFDFRLRPAGGRLAIRIDDMVGGRRTLTSLLTGEARPLRDLTLAWFAVKYPLLSLRVILAIHWQALRLRLKGVPWFAKRARASEQRDLFRPHVARSSVRPLHP